MRGFGAVQACFAYESQMDELAAAAGPGPGGVPDPQRDVAGLGHADRAGRGLGGPGRRTAPPGPGCAAAAARAARRGTRADLRELPGGVSNTTHGEGVVRGVGYGVGIKNVGFSEGFDDYSTARVTA